MSGVYILRNQRPKMRRREGKREGERKGKMKEMGKNKVWLGKGKAESKGGRLRGKEEYRELWKGQGKVRVKEGIYGRGRQRIDGRLANKEVKERGI